MHVIHLFPALIDCIKGACAFMDYLVPEREIEFFDTSAIRAASSVAAFLVFAAHYGEWEPYK